MNKCIIQEPGFRSINKIYMITSLGLSLLKMHKNKENSVSRSHLLVCKKKIKI